MAAPPKTHTIASLLANTEEEGDCLVWKGYYAHPTSPMVYDHGKMVSVRKLLLHLQGEKVVCGYYSAACENGRCVRLDHIAFRNQHEHSSHMAVLIMAMPAAEALRRAKISVKRRTVVSFELQQEILNSHETTAQLVKRTGLSKALINLYRRGKAGHTLAHNPWAMLIKKGKP